MKLFLEISLSPENRQSFVEMMAEAIVLAGEKKSDKPELVTRKEYAKLNRIHPDTVSRLFTKGTLKGKRMGRQIYIDKNQFREAI